jgi:hypothetical protein
MEQFLQIDSGVCLGSSHSLGKRESKAGWWIGEISNLRIVRYFLRLLFPIRVFLAYDSFCGGNLMDG